MMLGSAAGTPDSDATDTSPFAKNVAGDGKLPEPLANAWERKFSPT